MSGLKDEIARAVLREAAFSILVVDALVEDFPIVFGNEFFENMMGFGPKEYLGKNPRFLQGDDRDQPGAKKLKDAIMQGLPTLARLRNYRKNGEMFINEIYISPIRNDDGVITHYLGIHNDITDFTKKQADLNKAQSFLEAVPDAMIIVDTDGIIQFATPQSQSLLGYTTEELQGKTVDVLVPDGFRKGHHKHRANFVAKGKNRLMGYGDVLYARHKDGHEIPVEISLNPINTGDGTVISASLRDVTPRIKSEQQIKNALNVAESATQEKSRFLAAASHDLRQPLQSLNLYLSALQMVTKDNEKAIEIGEKMQTSLMGMKSLLDALLDISKLDSGSITPDYAVFSVRSLFRTVLDDFTPLARQKGLGIEAGSTDNLMIRSDLALLLRIIENFVSNAIRYTDKGKICLKALKSKDQVIISVSDTGIGIPEDALDKVFEEYYQLGNAHRDQGKGLGLGLSVVKRVADLLDHPLEARSDIGQGSTFIVSVPAVDVAEESPLPANGIVGRTNSQTVILCIDDNEAVLDSLSMMLDAAGYKLFLAEDGPAAMAHIKNGLTPDIILSDYRLPGPNGLEIVGNIREEFQNDVPVIMMTGDTSEKTIRQSGMERLQVLSKPVDVKALLTLIENMTN